MSVKIELGFIESGGSAPFFTLDDSLRGVLDNTSYPLGGLGEGYADVTNYLMSFNLTRGKSREFDRFNAGQLTATFNNNFREFDPTYTSSIFVDQIVPKRKIRVTVNDVVQFVGVTDDWNLDYDPAGISTATVIATDALAQLANINIFDYLPDEELSGARVNGVLDNIGWPAENRSIDTGQELMEAQIVNDGTIALDYLSTVEASELGFLFVSKTGDLRFIDRTSIYVESDILFSDNGSGIKYSNIGVQYGSEFLYNDIILTSTAGTVATDDAESQATYGLRQLQRATYLATEEQLSSIGQMLLDRYKDPEFRFQNLTVDLDSLTTAQRDLLATLELGDIVQVRFTPSNIPPAIIRGMRVVAINQAHSTESARLSIGLEAMSSVPLILDSELFGIIGEGYLGY